MSVDEWNVRRIDVDERGRLVMDIDPAYGNKKQYRGKAVFQMHYGETMLEELMQKIENRKGKAQKIETARTVLKEWLDEQTEEKREEQYQKVEEITRKFGLEVEDLPWPFRTWKRPEPEEQENDPDDEQ